MIKRIISWVMAFAMVALPLSAAEDQKEADRLDNCGTVLKEILDIPDDIPTDLLDKAECVMVIPSVLKFAVGFSGSYGKGAMTCRTGEHFTGPWSAPAMMRLEGGGVGFQLGGQATDFVILVMNPRGAKAILKSKVKLGADAAAAAGPKGRDAESPWKARRCAKTTARTKNFTIENSLQSRLSAKVPPPCLLRASK